MPRATGEPAARLIAELTERGLRVAVAESLTGGLVVAELTSVPGASVVVSGGVVAYDTSVKGSVLGVDAELLEAVGAVHPEVARQMADHVRTTLAVDGRAADLGIATTGVAGPTGQDGKPPGTVFIGVAFGGDVEAIELALRGSRAEIRTATVHAAIAAALARVGRTSPKSAE
ncbi:nicotinamide-nucleotide amidohydrolase family protein [Agromyces fucosus]|uniref:Nicotinamide-nucleotide amidohydrolase family protein n=1 Tax=Agromyces fucosus TaxID=41985 RepID=A0A4Q2JIM7_9MICO|nr:nicotinamide-nucleotide amidohydrolase family protein [Agromyces fucosus]RXZ46359.1 nicotinamide-nucleotide amidohydrolase family protein [Agromyces fucosus]